MRGETGQDGSTYWKRPWHKWLSLVIAILLLLCLWMSVREYHNISTAGILSPSQWADYAASKKWQCAINALLLSYFLGAFLIGIFARTQRAARLAEGVLLLILAFAWAAAGFAWHLFSPSMRGLFAALILLIALGAAVHSLWQYGKNRCF